MKKLCVGVVLLGGLFFCGNGAVQAQTLEERKQEMVNFVEEGLAFAQKNGKEAFLKEIMREGTPFVRGELYFYAYDWDCVCISHGEKPHLVGKNLVDLTDKKGLKVIQALRDAAANGTGFVEYYWQHPTTMKVMKKIGYVVKVDDTYWFGSGIYVEEGEDTTN